MSKFKVGDIVVGNHKAERYGTTRPGRLCVVKQAEPELKVDVSDPIPAEDDRSFRDEGFTVDETCFDLAPESEQQAPEIEGHDPEPKKPDPTVTLLYTERCTMKLRTFSSQEKMEAFVGRFALFTLGDPDASIDAVFHGAPIKFADCFQHDTEA